jgi:hypothetical protein
VAEDDGLATALPQEFPVFNFLYTANELVPLIAGQFKVMLGAEAFTVPVSRTAARSETVWPNAPKSPKAVRRVSRYRSMEYTEVG